MTPLSIYGSPKRGGSLLEGGSISHATVLLRTFEYSISHIQGKYNKVGINLGIGRELSRYN